MKGMIGACVVLALVLVCQSAVAAVPQTMSYQGVLRDAAGNVVPDGNYNLTFRIYNVAAGGAALWTEVRVVAVADGIFNVVLGSVNPLTLAFDVPYWLETTVGATVLMPRVQLASAPYALRAQFADVGAPDADWLYSGDDIYRTTGGVGIGDVPYLAAPESKDGQEAPVPGDRSTYTRLYVTNAARQYGIYGRLYEEDAAEDGRAAIYAYRTRTSRNDGTGYGPTTTNNAIVGYDYWGDSYTFGVAGFTYGDYGRTGGVLGANGSGTVWGSLAYRDDAGVWWGLYTPYEAYVSGFRMPTGAAAGEVLTCDANGVGSWQPSAGGIGGGGTANYVSKFTAATTLGNSISSTAPVPQSPSGSTQMLGRLW